jgi:hypothetical protein
MERARAQASRRGRLVLVGAHTSRRVASEALLALHGS